MGLMGLMGLYDLRMQWLSGMYMSDMSAPTYIDIELKLKLTVCAENVNCPISFPGQGEIVTIFSIVY